MAPNVSKQTGRMAALECLDAMLADAANIQKLHTDLQELFDASPANFFIDFVMPLLKKSEHALGDHTSDSQSSNTLIIQIVDPRVVQKQLVPAASSTQVSGIIDVQTTCQSEPVHVPAEHTEKS